MPHDDDQQNAFISWRSLAMGSCGIVLTCGGWIVGIWAESLDKRIDSIALLQYQQSVTLSERAGLAPRMEGVERELDKQREQLREVERRMWRQGH